MSVLKMQVVRADENISTMSRLGQCLRSKDIHEAERLLGVLIEGNHVSLKDL